MGCVSTKKTASRPEIRPAIQVGNQKEAAIMLPDKIEHKEEIVKNEKIEKINIQDKIEIVGGTEKVEKIEKIEKKEVQREVEIKKNSEVPELVKKAESIKQPKSKIIGNYEILEEIVKIPYGSINKCIHSTTGLKRTIKSIHIKLSEGISMNPKHLATEIKNLKSLDHPNVLKIHDMFQNDKKFYVVMDPWEGSLLIDSLSELQNISEHIVANIVSQILLAVAYCHSKKVIHRDLNPKIIFISDPSNPKIKISEFGASSFMDPENTFAGKRHSKIYVAPEVFDNFYNEKCDLWSVGVILHLLLVGDLPFHNREHPEKPYDTINTDHLQIKGISWAAIDLLFKLLEKDFSKRISATEALEHDWIKKFRDSQLNNGITINALQELKQFKKHSDAQDALKEFIAGQIVSFDESVDIAKAFKALDTNWDGRISREELLAHYIKTMGETEAKSIVENIFLTVDRDRSGFIEYNEFIKANMKKRYLMSLTNLETAFKLLDSDNSNKLSKTELQNLVGDSGDKDLMKLIAEADTNGDGEIDFKEFYALMRQKYDNS